MTRVACIDIGTVTARLAVGDVEGGKVVRMAKHSHICNLGQDVDKTGELAPEAMDRTIACVYKYVMAAREAQITAACCTLTSAARDAHNADELVGRLATLGLTPTVIPGEVEGALTFLGAAQAFPQTPLLVADSGGGSTELVLGELHTTGELTLNCVRSVDMGCRRLTDRCFSQHPEAPATDQELAAAHQEAAAVLAPAIREYHVTYDAANPRAPRKFVVCGGTATSMIAISKALDPYDPAAVHLAELTREELTRIEGELAHKTLAERAQTVGLQAKRAPVILAGAVVLSELLKQTGFSSCIVSESDLLFGLSLSAAAAATGEPSPVGWVPTLCGLQGH